MNTCSTLFAGSRCPPPGRSARMMRPKRGASALTLAVVLGIGLNTLPTPQAQTLTRLYSFCPKEGCADGSSPWSGVVLDKKDNAYGTTLLGGAGKCSSGSTVVGCGTVFEVSAAGKHTVLHSFKGAPDGAAPYYGSLIRDAKGNLYGATAYGGAGTSCTTGLFPGCGTVFEVSGTSEKILYSFKGGTDGSGPNSGLVMDAKGNLYGTTGNGGDHRFGTVFRVATTGTAGKTTVYSFGSKVGDGVLPGDGLVIDATGNLYGIASHGGANSYGAVFKIDASLEETVLYSFKETDPSNIVAPLTVDAEGNLYGVSQSGGLDPHGEVFKVTQAGTLTVLLSAFDVTNGATPTGGLAMDASGDLYGTTADGGSGSGGTVFKLDPSLSLTVLYNFCASPGACPEGAEPLGTLVLDAQGNLYGTTSVLGPSTYSSGTVFKLAP